MAAVDSDLRPNWSCETHQCNCVWVEVFDCGLLGQAFDWSHVSGHHRVSQRVERAECVYSQKTKCIMDIVKYAVRRSTALNLYLAQCCLCCDLLPNGCHIKHMRNENMFLDNVSIRWHHIFIVQFILYFSEISLQTQISHALCHSQAVFRSSSWITN